MYRALITVACLGVFAVVGCGTNVPTKVATDSSISEASTEIASDERSEPESQSGQVESDVNGTSFDLAEFVKTLVAEENTAPPSEKPITDAELDIFEERLTEPKPMVMVALMGELGRQRYVELLRASDRRNTTIALLPAAWNTLFVSDLAYGRRLHGQERQEHFRRSLACLAEHHQFLMQTREQAESKEQQQALAGRIQYIRLPFAEMAFAAGELEAAEHLARETLAQNTDSTNWNYGNIIHNANQILGLIAIQQGDVVEAKRFLVEAGKTPGSAQLNSFGPSMELASQLLQSGESEAVLQYLERVSTFWDTEPAHELIAQWKLEIIAGKVPDHPRWRQPTTAK